MDGKEQMSLIIIPENGHNYLVEFISTMNTNPSKYKSNRYSSLGPISFRHDIVFEKIRVLELNN